MTDTYDPYNPHHAHEKAALGARKQRARRGAVGNGKDGKDSHGPPLTNGFDARLGEVSLADFYAYMPEHTYIYVPTREQWPASSVNSLPPVGPKKMKPSTWLDRHKPVQQMTWAPGKPLIITDLLVSHGGWIKQKGVHTFNSYRPPMIKPGGDSTAAGRWIEHLKKVYPDDADHICDWLAHRVQRPQEKINHALVLGGKMGIGKDSILEPVKVAIGHWNFEEINPTQLLGRFNGFIKSVILRISEVRELGDIKRDHFYDHLKAYTAAPPDVLRCDEKHRREYSLFNCCAVIITTNYKTGGFFLPEDDRRHYVAWSDSDKKDFTSDYWDNLHSWYRSGGTEHVCAFLRTMDISRFDPKAPPKTTPAFWEIVAASRAPEDAELADVIDLLNKPDILTVSQAARSATDGDFASWLRDRKNSKRIPYRFEACGYVAVQNDDCKDRLWIIDGKRQIAYGKATLSLRERIAAARLASGYRR